VLSVVLELVHYVLKLGSSSYLDAIMHMLQHDAHVAPWHLGATCSWHLWCSLHLGATCSWHLGATCSTGCLSSFVPLKI